MSMPEIGEQESRKMLKIILGIFGGAALILTTVLVGNYLYYLSSPQKPFFIDFAGDISFNNGNSTWLIDNQGDRNTKRISVYRVGTVLSPNLLPEVVRASELFDLTGKNLDSRNIGLNGTPVLMANFSNGRNIIDVTLNDSSLFPSSFDGRILVSGGTPESVPITISTKPLLFESILLVVIGALTSVCIWEVIRYFKTKTKNISFVSLNGRYDQLQGLTANPAIQAEMDYIGRLKAVYFTELITEKTRNTSGRVTIPKIVIMEVLASLLGVAIALFGILYNESVTGVKVLDFYQVLTLLGIGLGVGSLKELVDKF
jgi:hypothetical protein